MNRAMNQLAAALFTLLAVVPLSWGQTFSGGVTPLNQTNVSSQTFTVTFTDSNGNGLNGTTGISGAGLLFNYGLDGTYGCYLFFVPGALAVGLQNDASDGMQGAMFFGADGNPITGNIPANSQCGISASGAHIAMVNGTTVTFTLPITFQSTFVGTQTVFAVIQDFNNQNTGWQSLGTWSAFPSVNQPPTAVSVSPTGGEGAVPAFAFTLSSPNGYRYMLLDILGLNGVGPGACAVLHYPGPKTGYLLNDAGTDWLWGSPILFGSSASVSGQWCTLSGSTSSASGSGNQLVVHPGFTLRSSFAGLKTISGAVGDRNGLYTGLVALGTWTLNYPVPSLTGISPTSATAGSTTFTLTVTGTNFVSGSTVLWNGSSRTTTFVNSTQLTAVITAADVAAAGTRTVTVMNPTPGGGTSGSATFTINNPVPSLTVTSPTSATAGSTTFTLAVTGTNFVPGSTVLWNGSSRTTTVVNSNQLTAVIAAADVAAAGTLNVAVVNPAPGGGTSGNATFTINNPPPSLTGISPASVTAGSAGFTLSVYGTNFVTGSVVNWNASPRTTSRISSMQLTATIAAADIAVAGTSTLTVVSPAPGGGTTSALSFYITTNPAPTVSTISPSSAGAGSSAFVLTVNGTGFVATSAVRWNGSDRTTSYFNSTQLTATINAADVASAGTSVVTVANPPPGGGPSGGAAFTIIDTNPPPSLTGFSPASATAGSGAFTLTVSGEGFVATSFVQWNGTSRATTFVGFTQLTASITANDVASAGTPTVTVINPGVPGSNGMSFTVTPAITNPSPSPGFSRRAGSPGSTIMISGQAIDAQGAPAPGVTITLSGPAGISPVTKTGITSSVTQTDTDGTYWFSNLPIGATYTLTPSMTGITPYPQNVTFPSLSSSATADFSTQPLLVAVTVSPKTAVYLPSSQSYQFAATVSNTSNTAVTWSISPSLGSITTAGYYTAPASITSAQTVTVTATSSADNTKSDFGTVNLVPDFGFTVANYGYNYAYVSTSASFSFTISNATGQVTFSVSAPDWAPQSISPLGNGSMVYTVTPPVMDTFTFYITITASDAYSHSHSIQLTLDVYHFPRIDGIGSGDVNGNGAYISATSTSNELSGLGLSFRTVIGNCYAEDSGSANCLLQVNTLPVNTSSGTLSISTDWPNVSPNPCGPAPLWGGAYSGGTGSTFYIQIKESFYILCSQAASPAARKRAESDSSTPGSGTISGLILGPDGRPLKNAIVHSTLPPFVTKDGQTSAKVSKSNDDGTFTLDGLSADDKHKICVEAVSQGVLNPCIWNPQHPFVPVTSQKPNVTQVAIKLDQGGLLQIQISDPKNLLGPTEKAAGVRLFIGARDTGGGLLQPSRLVNSSATERDYDVLVPQDQPVKLWIANKSFDFKDENGKILKDRVIEIPVRFSSKGDNKPLVFTVVGTH